ncbi:MAG: hypothetical protein ACPHQO_02270 [Candidatus Kariarchaeum pelagius]
MSNATKFPIQFNNPKTIWTLSLLLLYTILSMIPFYYYLTNLVNIDNDGIYFLQYLPIFAGLLLYFIQFLFLTYFWNEEKVYKKRDILNVSLKSYILVFSMFYSIYFLIFGYWIGNTNAYESALLSDTINRNMIQLLITLGTILTTYLLMQNIQDGSYRTSK